MGKKDREKENGDREFCTGEGENEGARADGIRIKDRYISEHKRNFVRTLGLTSVDFSRGVQKEQGQEAGGERET